MSDGALALNQTVEENLVQLETAFQEQTDYVSIVQKLQGQLDELVRLMGDVPFWSNTEISLEDLARKTETFDFYRLARHKRDGEVKSCDAKSGLCILSLWRGEVIVSEG